MPIVKAELEKVDADGQECEMCSQEIFHPFAWHRKVWIDGVLQTAKPYNCFFCESCREAYEGDIGKGNESE